MKKVMMKKSMTNTGKEIPGMFEMAAGGSTREVTPQFDSDPNLIGNQKSSLPDFLQKKIIKSKSKT